MDLPSDTVQTKPSFLSWHYGTGLSQFAASRIKGIGETLKFFNISNLFKNLFAPYKRLAVGKKDTAFGVSGLFDRITFNLTSIFVGANVRLILIVTGFFAAIIMAIVNSVSIIFYAAIPLFSIGAYTKLTQNVFYEEDITDPLKFVKKLATIKLFQNLRIFFDPEFIKGFEALDNPAKLGITPNLKHSQIILKLSQNLPAIKNYLDNKNIKPKEFETLVNYLEEHTEAPKAKSSNPIGQMLSFGYTNTLDKFCSELTSLALPPSAKKPALLQIEKVLARPANNNVLLVGEPGVGRHNLLYNLASEIQKGLLLALSGRRIMLLDTIALTGTGENLLEIKSNFEAILEEAKRAGNIILVLDQIDRLASAQEARIDLSEVLTATLKDNTLPIIGISTIDDFNRFIRPNALLLKLFEKIDVVEPPAEETIEILTGKALELYQREGISTTYEAIGEIVDKTTKLLPDRRQPDKSILLLSDLAAEVKNKKVNQIEVNMVHDLLETKTSIPMGAITQKEAEKLKNLEEILHKRIVGQDEAIVQIAKSMRRARAETQTGSKPIGSFLFLGPTGVGKTETAKALAEVYFGSEEKMVRLDMSEFQQDNALERLIGNIESNHPGQLASLIRQNPFGLFLADEFEKANREVHNLFLQILDEGFLTDAFGKKVSFDNEIIIATSNAGAEFIREQVSKGATADLSKKLVEYVLQKGILAPELINRFDGVVVYHPLTKQQAVAVAALMLARLATNLKETKNIDLEISQELATLVAQKGFDPTFGARPMQRLIADKIEDGIAKMIIEGSAKTGTKIPAAMLTRFLS